MLARVVATDDGRGRTARRGDGHGVVYTVSYPGAVSRRAGHGGGGRPAGEGLGDVEFIEVKSQQDHVGIGSTDGVDALHEGRSKMNKLLSVLHLPVPEQSQW